MNTPRHMKTMPSKGASPSLPPGVSFALGAAFKVYNGWVGVRLLQ